MNYVESFDILGVNARQTSCVVLSSAPTSKTVGAVGVLAMDQAGNTYKCIGVNGDKYTWVPLGGMEKVGEISLDIEVTFEEEEVWDEEMGSSVPVTKYYLNFGGQKGDKAVLLKQEGDGYDWKANTYLDQLLSLFQNSRIVEVTLNDANSVLALGTLGVERVASTIEWMGYPDFMDDDSEPMEFGGDYTHILYYDDVRAPGYCYGPYAYYLRFSENMYQCIMDQGLSTINIVGYK